MRITTKNLILVSRNAYNQRLNTDWILYTREKKYSDQLGTELAHIYIAQEKNCSGYINLQISIKNKECFEAYGAEGIKELIKRYIFRQKDIFYIKYQMNEYCHITKNILEKLGFSQAENDTDCWIIEKPLQHYTLLFIMVGGLCGMSFGRYSAAPFLMVLVGFGVGFLIGFPLDKKDKEARL